VANCPDGAEDVCTAAFVIMVDCRSPFVINSVYNYTWLFVVERGGRSGSSRRAAEASTLTASDDDFDCNETMSVVSNCSDMQTVAQLTDGECGVLMALQYHYYLVCK